MVRPRPPRTSVRRPSARVGAVLALAVAAPAVAAPVVCDPAAAERLVAEARVDPSRVPVTHPWLAPGLATSGEAVDPELREALAALCAGDGALSIEAGDGWETAAWSAHTLLLSRSETRACTVVQHTLALTVGVRPGEAPAYRLRDRLPVAHTPIGDCQAEARYREEQLLAGEGEPVRLFLVVDRVGDERVHSEVVVRRASPRGWTEHVLVSPAPDRLLDGGSGPRFTLAHPEGETWVVATGDRAVDGDACTPVPGQTVWTWDDGWQAHTGRGALSLLAARGLWRLAGEEGWLLLLAQDDAADRELLEARKRRLQRRQPEVPLLLLDSSPLPELNPGFLVVTPPPFTSQEAAEAAERGWGRRATSYVKRAWPAGDGCAEDPAGAPTRNPRG